MSKSTLFRNAKNKDLRFLNFKSDPSGIPMLQESEVPTLLPDEKMKALVGNDAAPYFKIQAIPYPAMGSGPNWQPAQYTEEFFQSFIDVTKSRPIPGDKRGHTYQSRPASDFYMVGGKIMSKGDGTGVAYFKNYVPPMGDTTPNDGFIRDNKAGIVNFSLVTRPEYVIKSEGIGKEMAFVTGTNGMERNDAVEYGAGAMDQATNSIDNAMGINTPGAKNARALIDSGKIDSTSTWTFNGADGDTLLGPNKDNWTNYAKWFLVEDDSAQEETKARYKYPFGKNGRVYRSALRAIAARAAQQDLSDVSDLASELLTLVEKKKGKNMDKKELLETLRNMKDNGSVNVSEIIEALGMKDQVIGEVHKNALSQVETLTNRVKELTAQVESVDADKVKNTLDAEFGPEKATDGQLNKLRHYAGVVLGNSKSAELEAKIVEFKKDTIALQLAGNRMDPGSRENLVNEQPNGTVKNRFFSGAPIKL